MTFVYALSSTDSWYSSGPMTPLICAVRPVPTSIREAQYRAVSRSIRRPGPAANCFVARPVQVAARSPGHVGDDVLLERACAYRDDPARYGPWRSSA